MQKAAKPFTFGSAAFACIVGVKVQVGFFSFKAHFHIKKDFLKSLSKSPSGRLYAGFEGLSTD